VEEIAGHVAMQGAASPTVPLGIDIITPQWRGVSRWLLAEVTSRRGSDAWGAHTPRRAPTLAQTFLEPHYLFTPYALLSHAYLPHITTQ
jgi:hypothetical protein